MIVGGRRQIDSDGWQQREALAQMPENKVRSPQGIGARPRHFQSVCGWMVKSMERVHSNLPVVIGSDEICPPQTAMGWMLMWPGYGDGIWGWGVEMGRTLGQRLTPGAGCRH